MAILGKTNKMNLDQQILDHILDKWGDETSMRKLNEQYRYTPPYPTLHLKDFIPEGLPEALYEESKTIPDKCWTTFTRAESYMEECRELKHAPVARQLVSALHSAEFL